MCPDDKPAGLGRPAVNACIERGLWSLRGRLRARGLVRTASRQGEFVSRVWLAAAVAVGLMSISAAGCSPPASSVGSSTPASPTPTPSPEGPSAHAYVVKQTETVGNERISGSVCNIAKPFMVTSVTPKVTFVFVFVPREVLKGSVSYAYSIPSAGESHAATGTYTISEGTSGILTLSLAVSDHVKFHGFDGNIPVRYKFDLVPTETARC